MGDSLSDEIELSIIIVNYNSGKLLKEVILSIYNNIKNINYEIIVVDNNSTDKSLAFNLPKIPFKLLKLKSNFGFGKANNIGVKNANGKYLYFLNPDAFIIDENTAFLLEEFEKDKKIGIVAPEILNTNGTLQYSCRLSPNVKRLFFYTFGITKIFRSKYVCDYKMEYWDHSKPIFSDWVSGAAFIIRKDTFNKVDGFDEIFFLFYEDVDLCKKVNDIGLKIKYCPLAKVEHIWGGTSMNLKEFTQKEEFRSRFKYFKKHHSALKLIEIKLLTFINVLFRILFFTVKGEFSKSLIFLKSLNIFFNEK